MPSTAPYASRTPPSRCRCEEDVVKSVVELMQQAVRRVRLSRHDASLEVGHDFVEGLAQRRAIGGEQRARARRARPARRGETPGRARSGAARSCRAAACPAAAARSPRAPAGYGRRRMLGRHQRQPAVAAQAAIPARTARVLTREQRILLGAARPRRCRRAHGRAGRTAGAPNADADATFAAAACLEGRAPPRHRICHRRRCAAARIVLACPGDRRYSRAC